MIFIRAMVHIFSFVENEMFYSTSFALLNRTFHLSPHENICTIALIIIHYLYNIAGGRCGRADNVLDSHTTGPGSRPGWYRTVY